MWAVLSMQHNHKPWVLFESGTLGFQILHRRTPQKSIKINVSFFSFFLSFFFFFSFNSLNLSVELACQFFVSELFSKLSPSNSEKCNHFVEAFARRLFISNWQQDCAVSRPMTGLWPSPIFVGNHLILRSASSLLALHCHWYVFR